MRTGAVSVSRDTRVASSPASSALTRADPRESPIEWQSDDSLNRKDRRLASKENRRRVRSLISRWNKKKIVELAGASRYRYRGIAREARHGIGRLDFRETDACVVPRSLARLG
jgi:hypothetical protein